MTERNRFLVKAREFLPRSGAAIAGTAAIAAVAFLLGVVSFRAPDERVPVARSGDRAGGSLEEDQTVWTCSMHPQVRMPGPGKCPICFMDLIPVQGRAGDELGPRQLRMSDAARELVQIATAPVRRAYAEREIRMAGKIAYDESNVASIAAWVPGRLDRLYADFTGITVNRGEHMVSLYSPELLAAQEELLQAIASAESLGVSESTVLRSTAVATRTAAREKLRLYGLAEQQIDDIITRGAPSEELTIYAPIGGVVIEKDALEGMYVQTGTRIYTIADLSTLWALFEAYESDLPWLRYGQHVDFTSPSFPGERFEARISFIDPVVDASTRTVRVRAVLDNTARRLKPEMFIRGTVRSRLNSSGRVVDRAIAGKWICPMHPEVLKDGPGGCDVCGMPLVPAETLGYAASTRAASDAPLLIPASAPLITGRRAVVYVELPVEGDPLFEGREVELGPRAGEFYVVQSGLEEGELVVINGAFKIDSELQIRAKPSMMSPKGIGGLGSHTEGDPSSQSSAAAGREHGTHTHVSSPEPGLHDVFDHYFQVQTALAGDDLGRAVAAYQRLGSALEAGTFWRGQGGEPGVLASQRASLRQAAAAGSAAEDITRAREVFYDLSHAMIELQETAGNPMSGPVYLAYCPMARNHEGASWLQVADTVLNPYFGSRMLRCGEIQKTLPAMPGAGR